MSGTDGNDTSFFAPGSFLSTLNPPPGTGPRTTTELDGNTNPNFFGTSSAAPNLAAVAALMKQLAPSATPTAIKNAMLASTIPLNGTAKGQWDVQGGFGLVQADAALAAVNTFNVVSATPGNGQTLTTAPSAVVVTFNLPVDPTTIQASDLQFLNVPPGVTVTVGTPVFNTATPNTVTFPINLTTAPGVLANGSYTYTLAAGAISSSDNRPLVAFQSGFTLNVVASPRVTGTTVLGRTVIVQFSEAMRPSTIDASSVQLLRIDPKTATGPNRFKVLDTVTNEPGAVVTYDAVNNRAIIDLSAVSQRFSRRGAMPSRSRPTTP